MHKLYHELLEMSGRPAPKKVRRQARVIQTEQEQCLASSILARTSSTVQRAQPSRPPTAFSFTTTPSPLYDRHRARHEGPNSNTQIRAAQHHDHPALDVIDECRELDAREVRRPESQHRNRELAPELCRRQPPVQQAYHLPNHMSDIEKPAADHTKRYQLQRCEACKARCPQPLLPNIVVSQESFDGPWYTEKDFEEAALVRKPDGNKQHVAANKKANFIAINAGHWDDLFRTAAGIFRPDIVSDLDQLELLEDDLRDGVKLLQRRDLDVDEQLQAVKSLVTDLGPLLSRLVAIVKG